MPLVVQFFTCSAEKRLRRLSKAPCERASRRVVLLADRAPLLEPWLRIDTGTLALIRSIWDEVAFEDAFWSVEA